ncbi:cell division protein FtsA [Sporanaerobium hydrogeniformans]|uniref:Cell division protein FtsA n=1 Tax=Sporanaerobium hydrogeniformans TaxID=3072179 RepID=A0AC61DEW3_9FIRM|nr:cell division protein FtsA [Sporanaerobium hydrogeniformans]PHV71455.1 cell division protein FtsA [Sporanaerobium hydrogeniformans]
MQEYTNEELIFGLDIGTRTVIGIVGYKKGEQFVTIAYERIAHEERAMLDGQIHDIHKVAKTVAEAKNRIEKKLNISLREVAIAAAGRTLNTQIVSVETSFNEIQEIALTDIHNLELFGVEKAKKEQEKKNHQVEYFCVAYSVINYYLDGYVMGNLEGHKGNSIGAKVIATFLPKPVIDSLYAVVERCDLTVSHLTLEPIAAINAIIPENLRLLNLALVDIGAGTSDIAITREGSVVAYGMIPIAGDEVTEAIVHHYLVDFNTAEKIKYEMKQSELIAFEDILGFPQEVTVSQLEQVIHTTLETLTTSIAEKMVELNGGQPTNAVFCVGGGSEMYGVESQLAEKLGLPSQRVAMRKVSHVSSIKDEASLTNSPDMITPIGICLTSMKNKYSEFTTLTLNGQKIQLLNAKKLTICDAIIAAGISHTAIFPKRGNTLMFRLNGQRVRIKGEAGIPAQIWLNQKKATINDLITEGDEITLELALQGKDGEAFIKDYMGGKNLTVFMEGETIQIPFCLVNGDYVPTNYRIQEGDQVEVICPSTLDELLNALQIEGSKKIITSDFKLVEGTHILQNKDSFLIDNKSFSLDGSFKGAAGEPQEEFMVATEELKEEKLILKVNGQTIELPQKGVPYMFANIFDYIDFDLSTPRGTIQLIRNGKAAALTDNLCNQDELDIFWKN